MCPSLRLLLRREQRSTERGYNVGRMPRATKSRIVQRKHASSCCRQTPARSLTSTMSIAGESKSKQPPRPPHAAAGNVQETLVQAHKRKHEIREVYNRQCPSCTPKTNDRHRHRLWFKHASMAPRLVHTQRDSRRTTLAHRIENATLSHRHWTRAIRAPIGKVLHLKQLRKHKCKHNW
jgi:hypothetical protein